MEEGSGCVYDQKHMTSSAKHGGGSVKAWACLTAGTFSLIIIDDGTHDG